MIIVRLQGGLGNQLFQYAAARYLAQFQKNPVILFDTMYYRYVKNRRFILNQFQTQGRCGSIADYPFFWPATLPVIGNAYYRSYHRLHSKGILVYSENSPFTFDKNLQCITTGDIYLDGFWQNIQYPAAIDSVLRAELTLHRPLSAISQKYAALLNHPNSVAIHVRRGDYVNNPNFPICSLSYYQKAIQIMQKKLHQPRFFFFSDDLEWVRVQFSDLSNSTFVEGVADEVDEFVLLTQASHNIISNSTFSWWAAWLHSNQHSIIIAPEPWQSSSEVARELYVKEWVKLPR